MVLALLIKTDYPEIWSNAFEELQSLLAGGGSAHVDLYLRVLCAIDDEVVTFHVDRTRAEADHNSLIKVGVGCCSPKDQKILLHFVPPRR